MIKKLLRFTGNHLTFLYALFWMWVIAFIVTPFMYLYLPNFKLIEYLSVLLITEILIEVLFFATLAVTKNHILWTAMHENPVAKYTKGTEWWGSVYFLLIALTPPFVLTYTPIPGVLLYLISFAVFNYLFWVKVT